LSGALTDGNTGRTLPAGNEKKDPARVLWWGVFQRNFDMPQASFDGMQDACDYANEIAKTRLNSMVLIRKNRDPAANPETTSAWDSSGK
jgi:hypothetical protein